MILGVGCILYSDEGFGIHVVQKLQENYEFDENVSLVDGGVLGLNLLGIISEADYLIVVDAIRNNGNPGDIYRLAGDDIPARVRAKNSLHQVDFIEALAMCQALDKIPETVIIGIEPKDIETLCIDLTDVAAAAVDKIIEKVLQELDHINISYKKRSTPYHVSCDSFQNYRN